jgi:hypothetical protein
LIKSTVINVYINVTQEHGWMTILVFVEYIGCKNCLCKCYTRACGETYLKLLIKSTGINVYVNVTHEHRWMTILETVE